MTEQLNYIERTLTQTAEDIKALAQDVRDILVHQKALNGSVGENTRSIGRLAKTIAECDKRTNDEFRQVHQRLCEHSDTLNRHDRDIATLCERAAHQEEEQNWTRTQLFETATRVAGLVAKLTAIGGIVYFLLNNLP